MPSANEKTLREALRLWSAGDLDSCLVTMRPDVEWHLAFPLPDLPPNQRVYIGRDQVRMIWNSFRSVWEEITLELEEILHEQSDLIVARAQFHARAGGSGVELDRTIFYVFEFDQGLLTRLRPFDTAAEARAAAAVEQ